METMNITIDGTKLTVEQGTTVLEAARSADIFIPALCSHPNLPSSRQVSPLMLCTGERKKWQMTALKLSLRVVAFAWLR